MVISQFLKNTYKYAENISNQQWFVVDLFRAAGNKTSFPKVPGATEDITTITKLFTSNNLSKDMKAGFNGKVDEKGFFKFFDKEISVHSLGEIMNDFEIKDTAVRDKRFFVQALCKQFSKFVFSKTNEVEDVITTEYLKLLHELIANISGDLGNVSIFRSLINELSVMLQEYEFSSGIPFPTYIFVCMKEAHNSVIGMVFSDKNLKKVVSKFAEQLLAFDSFLDGHSQLTDNPDFSKMQGLVPIGKVDDLVLREFEDCAGDENVTHKNEQPEFVQGIPKDVKKKTDDMQKSLYLSIDKILKQENELAEKLKSLSA